jgi:glycosyltransferase involved in cell wall biosynthesis
MNKPLISVIMPAYNAEKLISASIDSILSQTYANFELLICNDASKDNTAVLVKKYTDKRIKFFTNEKNLGYLRTINFLMSKCTGDFIAFQDADDISHPKRFEVILSVFESDNKLALCGSNFDVIDDSGKVIHCNEQVETNSEIIAKKLIEGNMFQKPSIIFKKELYEKIGAYREDFLKFKNISEDYDWLLRANEQFKLGNINYTEALYQYRSVSTAMTKGFTHVDQLFGAKIAQFLAEQRKRGEKDSIEIGDLDRIFEYIDTLKKPYLQDPSLFYRERAETLMYSGLKRDALNHAFSAVKKNPKKFINYRLLQYCLRKYLIGV